MNVGCRVGVGKLGTEAGAGVEVTVESRRARHRNAEAERSCAGAALISTRYGGQKYSKLRRSWMML